VPTIARLRSWLIVLIVLILVVVAGFLTYGKWIVRNALKNAAKTKLGIEYQQSTEGFSLSKSQGGHTLFTVRASKAVTYKQTGRAQLNDVNITVYGRQGDRFDQIYGKQFEYDPKTHVVSAAGDVQIDLQSADPNAKRPDQTPPAEVKNPVHLKTSGLSFNETTGIAHTDNMVEFSVPQAEGTAQGVTYDSKARTLTLAGNIHLKRNGPQPVDFRASHGIINSEQPSRATFDQVRVDRPAGQLQADQLILYFRPDNSVDHVVANGNLRGNASGKSNIDFHSQHGEVLMANDADVPRRATLVGGVDVNATGEHAVHAQAQRVVADFTDDGHVRLVHALDGVHMTQPPSATATSANAQAVELTANAVDFFIRGGDTLERAETIGPAQVTATPTHTAHTAAKKPSKTVVTADKFQANFNQDGHLSGITGAPNAKMVTSAPGEPDRTTTSHEIKVAFDADGTMTSMVQQGAFEYHESQPTGERAAFAEQALYNPQNETLRLSGSPRVVEGGMTTTAETVLLNRASGEIEAQNNVKTTYNDLKTNAQGALFSAGSPVHVTARQMTASRAAGQAKYTGNARLWQDANIIEAPTITFDRARRGMTAVASGNQLVSTVLVQQEKSGKVTPVYVKSRRFEYDDTSAVAHFEGAVTLRASGGTMSGGRADIYLANAGTFAKAGAKTNQPGAARLERIVAEDNVRIEQEGRRVTGQKLVYTPADDKFVMTGGPPTINDPEHGTIVGSSLTFFRADDKVLVEGGASRTLTTTRVSR
jgi:lipopolysaccharide export system protein LptA